MSEQWIFIKAHDVWMFRDSKPFTAGESFFARSMFPPQPGTTQGLIRSFHYEHTGQIIGSATDMGGLRLHGAFLATRDSQGKIARYYPLPLDTFASTTPRRLAPKRSSTVVTDLGADWRPLQPIDEGQDDKPEDGDFWLDEANFAAYTDGQPIPEAVRGDMLYSFEERTGLGMDHGKRANLDGRFYRASFVRPAEEVGLLIGAEYREALFNEPSGQIAVGGEARMGTYSVVSYTPTVSTLTDNVKLVLLTPAYFSAGWQPVGGEWSRWLGKDAKLVSAAIGKPRAFSGWDMVKKYPKPLRYFVPAGSVFYFENATTPSSPFTETPQGDADYGAMGYGAFAAVAWNYADGLSERIGVDNGE